MADDPDDLTIQILRQIQAKLSEVQVKLSEHDQRFEQIDGRFERIDARFERMQAQIDYRFDGVERKLGELIDSTGKALGTAAIANVRHDSAAQRFAEVELELRELRAKVQRLEERV
jgi:DNA repair exonuclease SbcCD ATPase subunit